MLPILAFQQSPSLEAAYLAHAAYLPLAHGWRPASRCSGLCSWCLQLPGARDALKVAPQPVAAGRRTAPTRPPQSSAPRLNMPVLCTGSLMLNLSHACLADCNAVLQGAAGGGGMRP